MTGKPQLLKIKLKGGTPWGFRLQGGKGTGLPLIVAKVRRKSKAYNNLKEGDVIKTVNSTPCDKMTYEQVMTIADKCGNEIIIEVERTGCENAVPEIKKAPKATPDNEAEKATMTEEKQIIEKNILIEKESTQKVNKSEVEANIELTTISETIKKTTDNLPKIDVTDDLPKISTTDNLPKINTTDDLPKVNTTDDLPKINATDNLPKINIATDNLPKINIISDNFQSTKVTDTPLNVNGELNSLSYSEPPEVVSDVTVRVSSEISETGEKHERLETETFHEKSANKEISFVRTDFEEETKTCIPPTDLNATIENSHFEEQIKSIPQETIRNNLTSESFESYKCEKTEVTTAKSFEILKDSQYGDATNSSLDVNNIDTNITLPSLDTDIMSTLQLEDFKSSNGTSEFASTTRKKKMFSSSSFYEEPKAIYPTVEEQFEMAKKIAESLAADTNKKSKGANMFFKRAMRAPKWVHEGPDPSCEFMETSEICQTSWSSSDKKEKKFQPLKLVLDPRHPVDLESLRSTGQNISEHNAISPDVCHGLIKDLQSPSGKGSAMFAKRKKKSSEWVVDEEKVKAMMKAQEQELNQIKQSMATQSKPGTYTSPWDSYLKSANSVTGLAPKGVNPDRLAETVMKAADVKRRDSIQSLQDEPLFESCRSPIIPATPAASYYDIYRARAPKGWAGSGSNTPTTDILCSSPIYPTLGYADPNNTAILPQNSYFFPKKYHFQNFNTVPRKWTSKR